MTASQSGTFDPARHFDESAAGRYDETIRTVLPGYETLHENLLGMLETTLPENASVLSCGAGTGQEILACAHIAPGWKFVGVDPSEAMLSTASEKIRQAGIQSRVTLLHGYVGDVMEMDFNAAASILVMQFIPDDGGKRDYLAAIAKRLKLGGIIVLCDLTGDNDDPETKRLLNEWRSKLSERGLDDEKLNAIFSHVESDVKIVTEDRVLELLDECGFIDVQRFHQSLLCVGWIARKAD